LTCRRIRSPPAAHTFAGTYTNTLTEKNARLVDIWPSRLLSGPVWQALSSGHRAAGRPAPQSLSTRDIFLLTVATHKLARLLAKDPVSSPLRFPFTRFKGTSGPSELAEDVREGGLRHAVGEMVTCPFCLAPWVVTALLATYSFSPAATRTVCSGLTAVAGSDFLQYAYAAVQQRVEQE
jgi:hypothetical protein